MNFPCDFTLKIIGTAEADLATAVRPILSKYIPDSTKVEISSKESKGGKYSSVTVQFEATSQEQLDNIYREISAKPEVIMAL